MRTDLAGGSNKDGQPRSANLRMSACLPQIWSKLHAHHTFLLKVYWAILLPWCFPAAVYFYSLVSSYLRTWMYGWILWILVFLGL